MQNRLLKTNNRYLKTALISFSGWFTVILVNVIVIAVLEFLQGSRGYFWEGVGLVLLVSAVFSFPGVVIFWLVFLFNFCHHKIFKILVITAIVTSSLPVLSMLLVYSDGHIHFQSVSLIALAILSAVIAVVLHRPGIKYGTSLVINETEANEKIDSLET